MSLEALNISKVYSKLPVVENFSIKCEEGKIVGILGPNGAGKTTILKALSGRHAPTSGKIIINGMSFENSPEFLKHYVGFVSEEPVFPSKVMVCDYLKMILDLHDVKSSSEYKNFQSELMEKLSINEIINKKIYQLSKGQKQRLNFAQALIFNPKILILDEPASGLDPVQILKMREFVKSLKINHSILLSTHLMQEVDALCDEVYIINKGKCMAQGRPEDICNKSNSNNLEEAFLKIIAAD